MITIAVYAVIIILFYVVLLLPQQRRAKEAKALLASLEVGDEVVMASGIHGFVTAIDGPILWIEVAENVELKVARSAVASRVVIADGDTNGAGA